jgi:hypothetical protein
MDVSVCYSVTGHSCLSSPPPCPFAVFLAPGRAVARVACSRRCLHSLLPRPCLLNVSQSAVVLLFPLLLAAILLRAGCNSPSPLYLSPIPRVHHSAVSLRSLLHRLLHTLPAKSAAALVAAAAMPPWPPCATPPWSGSSSAPLALPFDALASSCCRDAHWPLCFVRRAPEHRVHHRVACSVLPV